MSKIVVIGSLNRDVTVAVDSLPVPGETLLAASLAESCGGKGANQACAIARLGGDVTMLGAVGDDADGRALRESLCASGVDVSHLLVDAGRPTGKAFITVSRSGENTICVVQGANLGLTPAYLEQKRFLIEEADYVVMQLEIAMETVVYAARTAKAAGKTVILDPAPSPENAPAELWALVDLIKPNESELRSLVGCGAEVDSVEELCRRFREHYDGKVIVTLGEKGALLCEDGGTHAVPNYPAKAVDATAAGDSFLGALTVSLANGKPLPEAIDFGCRVAAITVSRPGAQESIPTAAEMAQYL